MSASTDITSPNEASRRPVVSSLAPGAESTVFARRVLYLSLAVFLAAAVGVSALFLKPILIIAVMAAGFIGVLVLRSPYVGLVLYIIIYLLHIVDLVPALEPLRVERLMGLLTLLSLALQQIQVQKRVSIDGTAPTRWFLLVIVAAILSVPLSYWRAAAITGVTDFVKLFIFYHLVIMLVDSRRRLRGFFFLYLVLMLYIAGNSIFHYVRGEVLQLKTIERAVGDASAGGGPNELGATMATTIPIYLLFAFRKQLGPWRWFFAVGAFMLLMTMALSGSRSALVGFLGGMAYLWWKSNHRVLFGLLGVILLAGGFMALPAQYQERYASIAESNVDIDTSQTRLTVWKKGLRMMASRPLTGVGINCFGTANALGFSGSARQSYLESHSLYIQVGAEMGIIGVVTFFSFLYAMMAMNRRVRRSLEAAEGDWSMEITMLNGMFVGAVVLLGTGVFGHSLMRYTWYLYAAFAICVWRIFLREKGPESAGETFGKRSTGGRPAAPLPIASGES